MMKLLKLLLIFVSHLARSLSARAPTWLAMSDVFITDICGELFCNITKYQRVSQILRVNDA